MTDEVRKCYICMDEGPAGAADWVSPCVCAGSIRWVHQHCIRRWVLSQERSGYGDAHCAQCLTPYRLRPEKSVLLLAIQLWRDRLYPMVRFVSGCGLVVMAVEVGFTALGVVAVCQVCGVRETLAMLDEAPPAEAVAYMHIVAAGLVAYSCVPWSDLLLGGLRRASRLPGLALVLPAEVPHPRALYEPRPRPALEGALASGLLLPACARLVGQALFSSVEATATRALMGGAVFLAAKGLLSMYLRQKLMRHRCALIVHEYEDGQPHANY